MVSKLIYLEKKTDMTDNNALNVWYTFILYFYYFYNVEPGDQVQAYHMSSECKDCTKPSVYGVPAGH